MTAQRVDLYTMIHKALRASMYQTGSLLERSDFSDQHEKHEALNALDRSLDFFDEHLHLEEEHIAPLLQDASTEVAGELSEQHIDHEQVAKRLRDLKEELSHCGGATALTLGAQLCKSYNKMIANQADHMNEEECAGSAALWSAHSDETLAATRAAIQQSIPPARYQEWLAIILPNANNRELIGMLSGVRAAAPPEVFSQLSKQAEQILGERWAKVHAALGE